MDKKVLLLSSLLGLLLVCAAASWWLSHDPSAATAPGGTARSEGVAAAADGSSPPGASDATLATAVTGTVRAAAATAGASAPPFPDDATWVPVRVVDKVTREPVPGAAVGWVGENLDRYYAEMDHRDPDLMFLWRSIDLQIERAGWRGTTDAEGIVQVTFKKWTAVVATDAGRFGRLTLHENTVAPPDGYVLELIPDLALTVQALDDAGGAAADVYVAIAVREGPDQPPHFWGWGPVARTDADGRATVRHLQQLPEDEARDATVVGAPRCSVRTYIPGYEDPGVPLALDALPTEPIVLRLPPCGSVRMRAEVAGRPAPGFQGASLVAWSAEQRGYRPDLAQCYRPVEADGWVHFRHLPLGQEFTAGCNGSGDLSQRFAGPIASGQEVVVRIAPGNDTMLLRGRMLAGERSPVRDADITLMARGPDRNAYQGFRTDGEGRFLVAVGEAGDDNRFDSLRFEYARFELPSLRADAPGRTLRAGIEDLGDLLLSAGKLVVAGTFVDDDGPLHRPVSFWVEHFDPAAPADAAWQAAADLMQHQDKTGGFEVRGDVEPGRLRLAFADHDQLPMEPVEFVPGTERLEVKVATGHALAATVLQRKGTPMEGIYALLTPARPDAGRSAKHTDEDRFRVEPWSEDGERLHVQWAALPAGSYTLALRLWTHRQPLAVIPDVVVPGPAGGDPRLADIDLRAAMRTVELNLFDADGNPLEPTAGAAFPVGLDPASTWEGTQLWQANTKVVVPASAATELLVAVAGFRPHQVLANGEQIAVRLDPWPTVEVVVDGMPALPPQVRMVMRLLPATPNEAPYRSQWTSGHRGELFDAGVGGASADGNRAVLPIGEGPHRIELALEGNRRHVELAGIEQVRVLPNSGHVVVHVPAASWTDALAAVTRDPDAGAPR